MKTARGLVIFTMMYVVSFVTAAVADDSDDSMASRATPSPSLYDPDAMIPARDFVQKKKPDPAAEAAAKQQQITKQQQQKDWLLRSYEQQLQSHNANPGNLYYQISTDKDLAKIAGLPLITITESASVKATPNPGSNGLNLRTDSTPSTPSTPPGRIKPIATTMSNFANLHNSFAIPTSGLQQYGPKMVAAPPTAPPATSNTFDLDTPGMVASGKSPLLDTDTTLTLDLLPGESPSAAKAHRENTNLLELPKTTHVAQWQDLENNALRAPGSIKTAPSVPLNPILLKLANEPPPVTAPPPSPIRNPVADPRAISYR